MLGAPFGVKGFVKAHSLSGEYAHLAGLKKAALRGEKGEFTLEIEGARLISQGIALKFRGIDSPEAAGALRGAEIMVPREEAAPLKAGEFYIEDLKGLRVEFEGQQIGTIADILEGGGAFLAELRLLNGQSRFVPFRAEFFGDIDTDKAELLTPEILE